MKKALSVFLAVLMMFSCLCVGASADSVYTSPYHGPGKPADYDQVVLEFNINGGTLKTPQYVYDIDTGEITRMSDITGTWVMVPLDNEQSASRTMLPGQYVTLPAVIAPEGMQFDGWYCYGDHQMYAQNGTYKLPAPGGEVVTFIAQYSPAVIEEDTMTKVMNILFSVFGTIIGLLFYGGDTEMGVALMEKIFGSIFTA